MSVRASVRRWWRLLWAPKQRDDNAFWATRSRAQHIAWVRLRLPQDPGKYQDIRRRMMERESGGETAPSVRRSPSKAWSEIYGR
jgi:hypothetical protein